MKQQNNIEQQIEQYTKILRLPAIRNNFIQYANQAAEQDDSYEQYLQQLMQLECEQRLQRRKTARIKRAQFPYLKHFEDLLIEELPADAQQKLKTLKRADFISQGRNIILAGNPGTGKTHLAIAIGIQACLNDLQVLFTTIPRLITQIKEARTNRNRRALENKFEKYDLVICDEFGYISFDKEAAELLFAHLSLRAGRKSTIITTNLAFDRWTEIFGDQVLTAAMVDRLTHKAILVNMNGESFRIKESMLCNQNQ